MLETTPASSTSASDLKSVDLVMKGGITSGVAYPPVILALRECYRFRRIGGTSAGALAAVASAAAEFNREGQGFEQLKGVIDSLKKPAFLRNLFQPSPDMYPLMTIIDALFPAPNVVKRSSQGKDKAPEQQIRPSGWQLLGNLLGAWLRLPTPLSLWAVVGMVIGLLMGLGVAFTVLGVVSLFLATSLGNVLFSGSLLAFVLIGLLLIGAIIGSLFGGQIGAVVDAIWKISNDRNLYGICSGMTQQGQSQPALTHWMHTQIQMMAGLKESDPLTFDTLSKKTDPQTGEDASITLKMFTTNLSQSQPHLMPDGLQGFLFKKQDMERLFPSDVVQHLTRLSQQGYIITKTDAQGKPLSTTTFRAPKPTSASQEQEYYFLPPEEDLPIVFAMRLSLSFPLLLSAVPLYTIQAAALTNGGEVQLQVSDLQRNWFSDGGICHNFPLEYFDSWLPHHPTFGINLTSLPRQAFEKPKSAQGVPAGSPTYDPTIVNKEHVSLLTQSRFVQLSEHLPSYASALEPSAQQTSGLTESSTIPAVYLPDATDPPDPIWDGLEQTWQFLSAILNTGLGYRETELASLPSYRERIVQIRLNSDEGGLNLNMSPTTIENVVGKGAEAGVRLLKFNFNHHQWVRFLVMINQLEHNLAYLRDRVPNPANNGVPTSQEFLRLLDAQIAVFESDPYPYSRDREWCDQAKKFATDLETLIHSWEQLAKDWESTYNLDSYVEGGIKMPLFFRRDAPLPSPVLRVSPEV